MSCASTELMTCKSMHILSSSNDITKHIHSKICSKMHNILVHGLLFDSTDLWREARPAVSAAGQQEHVHAGNMVLKDVDIHIL